MLLFFDFGTYPEIYAGSRLYVQNNHDLTNICHRGGHAVSNACVEHAAESTLLLRLENSVGFSPVQILPGKNKLRRVEDGFMGLCWETRFLD